MSGLSKEKTGFTQKNLKIDLSNHGVTGWPGFEFAHKTRKRVI